MPHTTVYRSLQLYLCNGEFSMNAKWPLNQSKCILEMVAELSY